MQATKLSATPAWVLMSVIVVLDQISKLLTRIFTDLHDSFPILPHIFGDTFRFTHLQNTGAAFSMSLSNPVVNRVFFITASVLAIIFILYLLRKATHRLQVWAFGFVLGGAFGNLIDRVFIGGVTDFVDVNIPDMLGMTRFPVFNVADSGIFIGMVLLIIDMIFLKDEAARPAVSEGQTIELDNKEL